MLILDAHQDIAWNIITLDRDYRRGARQIRQIENGTEIPNWVGEALLGKPEWIEGEIGLIFATIFVTPERFRRGSWDSVCYRDTDGAYYHAKRQLDAYCRLVESDDHLQLVLTQGDLAAILQDWGDKDLDLDERRIGLVLLMEGADPIRDPDQVEEWYGWGLRAIGLAWEETRYAGGAHEPGSISADGLLLMQSMQTLGMILDLSHIAEEAYWQALDRYDGPVFVSHATPRRFYPNPRALSDEMIEALAERGGVIGIALCNQFLKPGLHIDDPKESVTIRDVAYAVDHVCQLTGSVEHVGIGSDLDGTFGRRHAPAEIDTVADLQKIAVPLREMGYSEPEISAIFNGNMLRILKKGLPE
ncbi:MAG: membrane dipeptidase [Anaerolineae bacterium]|nr:membrane dipeptidase [Anaerolineae bacterium]